ncbi:MAG: methyltransferase domain-containing protein [Candidatus Glassbacteria bacterium]|nr:methyltransferase domain-containing protein [Candidatus Glassbacteria bacterium]
MSTRKTGRDSRVNKKIMALHFSRSASTYEKHATLQREIAWQLVDWAAPRLDFPGGGPRAALDIGCGTGFLTGFLLDRLHPGSLVGIDLAGGMLDRARGVCVNGTVRLVRADGERLPFAPASFDLVASSTAFQWFAAPADSLARIGRVLEPGGRLVFATMGHGTLRELKESYREAAGRMGIKLAVGRYGPPLMGEPELNNALQAAGYSGIECECRTKLEYFPGCREFIRSLKARGANNPNFRPMSIGAERRLLSLLAETYERRFTSDGLVYATYEVIFCSCRRENG